MITCISLLTLIHTQAMANERHENELKNEKIMEIIMSRDTTINTLSENLHISEENNKEILNNHQHELSDLTLKHGRPVRVIRAIRAIHIYPKRKITLIILPW